MKDKIFVKVRRGQKKPFEPEWQKHPYSYSELQHWISIGNNVSMLYSDITGLCCFDFDHLDKIPEGISIDDLSRNTLSVKTKRGIHLIYNRPEGYANKDFEWGNFLYQNKAGIVPPSKVEGVTRQWISKKQPVDVPKELLALLDDTPKNSIPDIEISPLNIENGERNNTLTHIVGVLRKTIPTETIPTVLALFNSYLPNPLPHKEIMNICKQAMKYNNQDNQKIVDVIYNILADPMSLRQLHNVLENEGYKTSYSYVQNAVGRLVKAGKVFRMGRGVYRSVVKAAVVPVSDLKVELGKPVQYDIPLHITDICDIYPNSVLMLASVAGFGKTHVFAHIIKGLLEQNVRCTYWDMENDLANIIHIFRKYIPEELFNSGLLNINQEDVSIESVKLDPEAVNFIDPIYVEDGWGEVDNLMRRLKKQLSGGLCFIATHVKDIDGKVFGGATAMKVPSFVMQLEHQGEDRFKPVFKVMKSRNWKSGCKITKIKCLWDDEKGLQEL